MTIRLTPEQEHRVQAIISRGAYESVEEALEAALSAGEPWHDQQHSQARFRLLPVLSTLVDLNRMSTSVDIPKGGVMHIRSPADLGALIREHRTKLELDQAGRRSRD